MNRFPSATRAEVRRQRRFAAERLQINQFGDSGEALLGEELQGAWFGGIDQHLRQMHVTMGKMIAHAIQ